jgi:hypothetical protein
MTEKPKPLVDLSKFEKALKSLKMALVAAQVFSSTQEFYAEAEKLLQTLKTKANG